MDEKELEIFWNNKHPKRPVIYTGRAIPEICSTCKTHTLKKNVNIDVTTMLSKHDTCVKKIIEQNQLIGQTYDDTIANIQKWTVQNIKYIGDDLNEGVIEYWQFPFETLTAKTGDCEDGALLIAALAINAGIPSFRIRIVAGVVQESETAPTGGHGYVAYLRQTDNEWVIIDWCYKEDSNIPVSEKTILKDNAYYKKIFFSFNDEFSWSSDEFKFASF